MKTSLFFSTVLLCSLIAVIAASRFTESGIRHEPTRIRQRVYGTCKQVCNDGRIIVSLTLGGTVTVKSSEPFDFETIDDLRSAAMAEGKVIDFITMIPASGDLSRIHGEVIGERLCANGKPLTQQVLPITPPEYFTE